MLWPTSGAGIVPWKRWGRQRRQRQRRQQMSRMLLASNISVKKTSTPCEATDEIQAPKVGTREVPHASLAEDSAAERWGSRRSRI